MSERLQKVLDFENRILQERKKLQELVAESTEDSKLINAKLDHFQKEINYMNQQVKLLKDEMLQTECKAEAEVVVMDDMPQENPKPEMIQFSDIKVEEKAEKVEPFPQQSRTSTKKDLEKTIGKSLMGVLASVLVFISLILFATAILPLFSDAAKMLTMYVVSFGFLIFGLYKWKKNQENKFYMALLACGVGALYISLLLSNMYFNAIGDIPLYILIAFWGLGVCFLCHIQTTLFQTIGHIGIFISVAFGCFLCCDTYDSVKFTVLLVYYFVTMVMFFAVNPKRKISENVIFHLFNGLNCLVLVPSACSILESGISIPMLVLVAFLGVNIGVLLWSETDAQGAEFAIFSCGQLLLFWGALDQLTATLTEDAQAACIYLAAILLFCLFEGKKYAKNGGKYVVEICLSIMATYAMVEYSTFGEEYLYVPLLVVPMVLVGYFRENPLAKYSSQVLLFFYLFEGVENSAAHFWLAFGAVVLTYALMYIKKEQYQMLHKCILHTLTIFVFGTLFSEMIDDAIYGIIGMYDTEGIVATLTYLPIVVFHMIMMKTNLGCNLKTGEKEKPTYYNFVNLILMIVGTVLISSVDNEICHMIVILVALAVFMVNAKNLLDKRDNVFAGIYVGIKFTILMLVILSSFEAENYVISTSCFLLAIVAVIVGFRFDYKALRLFGLILSMISTFKLIMVDISYQNTLGNAVSFFASGILCFAISMIYSLIDGKMKRERK